MWFDPNVGDLPGSPSAPFSSTAERDAAYASQTWRPGVFAWSGSPAVESEWIGPTNTDWAPSDALAVQYFAVTTASETALRAAIALAQSAPIGRKTIVIPYASEITITSPLPLGGGLRYVGSIGTTANICNLDGTGTVIKCAPKGTFNAFQYNHIDAIVKPARYSHSGEDFLGGCVKNIIVKDADYALKVGALWNGGISEGFEIDNFYAINCVWGVSLENCMSPIIGTYKCYKSQKTGFHFASSGPGWNYGNFNISCIINQSSAMLPGYPSILLEARGDVGDSDLNDINVEHAQTNLNEEHINGTGSSSASVVSGNQLINVGSLMNCLGLNSPIFFATKLGNIIANRAYFIVDVASAPQVKISLTMGGAALTPSITGAVTAQTRGNIGIAVRAPNSLVTNVKFGLTDTEACSIGVYAENYKGLIFNFGMCDEWKRKLGKIAFVGRAANASKACCNLTFAEAPTALDVYGGGNEIATGPLPSLIANGDNSAQNPQNKRQVLSVAFGRSVFTDANLTLAADTWAKVPFTSAGNYSSQLIDPTGGFDIYANTFTINQAGVYKITTRVRPADTASSGSTAGKQFAHGYNAGGMCADNSQIGWGVINSLHSYSERTIIRHFYSGNSVSMQAYAEDALKISDASMTIECLSVD